MVSRLQCPGGEVPKREVRSYYRSHNDCQQYGPMHLVTLCFYVNLEYTSKNTNGKESRSSAWHLPAVVLGVSALLNPSTPGSFATDPGTDV